MGILTPGSGFQTKFGSVDYRSLPSRYIWWNSTTTDRQPHYKGEYGPARGFLGSNGLRRSLFGAACDFSLWRRQHVYKQSWGLPKTVHFLTPSNTANVATDTTLAASTVYSAAALPIKIDEVLLPNGRKAFLSVKLIAYFWGQWSTNNGVTGTRVTFALGGATPYTIDRSHGSSSVAGRPTSCEVETDLTQYFNNNWNPTVPGGENLMQMDATCTIAVSTASAMNVSGHNFEIIATYAVEPSMQPTSRKRTKTLRIPIQGHDSVLTASQQEIGSAAGSPRTNQLPQLTGGGAFLKEASIEIIQTTIQLQANTADTALTNYTPQVQINADAEVPRALIERGNWTAGSMMWKDHFTYAGSYHGAANALSMRCDLTARLDNVSAFLVVTYAYNWSTTTTVTCVKMVPARNDAVVNPSAFAADGDQQGLAFDFDVVEGTPTLKQSAIVSLMASFVNTATLPARLGTAAERVWTFVNNVGEHFVVHRFDGDLSLVTGMNTIRYGWKAVGQALTRAVVHSAFALVMYDVTLAAGQDPDSVSRPVMFHQRQFEPGEGFSTSSINMLLSTSVQAPMLGEYYSVDGVMMDMMEFSSPAALASNKFYLESIGGDFDSAAIGFNGPARSITYTSGGTPLCSWHFRQGMTELFSKRSERPSIRARLEATRRQVLSLVGAASTITSWCWWLSVHNHKYACEGYVSLDGIDCPVGSVIKLWAYNAAGDVELVDTVRVYFEGIFIAHAHDKYRIYFATYDNDGRLGRSADTTPGNPFDIAMWPPTAAPTNVEITTFPATTTTSTSASFNFTSTDAAEYSVDGGAYAPATSPINLVGLSVAAHTIVIRSIASPSIQQGFAWTITGGGGDTTPPIITIVSPTPGTPLLRFTPLVLRVTDDIALRRVFIFMRFADSEIWETVHDGDNFSPTFPPPDNTRTAIIGPNGYEFNLLRLNGWPETPELHVIAIDAAGNMTVL